jgi:ADP-heptose:LPS heptosyltransferase
VTVAAKSKSKSGYSLRQRFQGRANEIFLRRLAWLNFFGVTLTVEDVFGTPGDTLMTAIICHEIKKRYSRLKINCVTPNPSLLTHDPDIDSLNQPRSFWTIRFDYLRLLVDKARSTNVLQPTMERLGITDYNYRARVFLTDEELAVARQRVAGLRLPIITINAMSREMVKVWPLENWKALVPQLNQFASVVQVGDAREPALDGVLSLGGKLSMRESMAVLAQADLHIGPDSFLMHAANGVGVPSVIIYGGSRPPACLGYPDNTNLFVDIECSPCWLHDSHGDKCPYAIKCMPMITPESVLAAVKEKLALGSVSVP